MTKQSANPQPFAPGSFAEMLAIEEVEVREGWALVRMSIRKHHLQEATAVHGGVIMTLADTAFWRAVTTLLSPGQTAATSELKVNFIKPARGDYLVAESRIIHQGSRLVVGDAEVTDGQGNIVALALGTSCILESGPGEPGSGSSA